jgi:hypothetical protein
VLFLVTHFFVSPYYGVESIKNWLSKIRREYICFSEIMDLVAIKAAIMWVTEMVVVTAAHY